MSDFVCPRCSSEVWWSCPSKPGSSGQAYCSRSGLGTRKLDDPVTCDWQGGVVRLDDGGVALFEQRDSPEKPKRKLPRGARIPSS